MDENKFNEILINYNLSAKGIGLINDLLSRDHLELLKGITNFNPEDIGNISKIKPCMEKASTEISDALYSHLLELKGLKETLASAPGLLEQLKSSNADYLKSLFSLNYDEDYYKNRIAVGLAHNMLGISPSIYIAIYSYYNHLVSSFILKCCQKNGLTLSDTLKIINSVQKALTIDTTLAIESYYKKSTDDYYKIEQESFTRLMAIAEYKDEDTGAHIERVSNYARIIAKNMGLSNYYQERIFYASPMHDIGKVGIPDNVLLKKGKLTDAEFEIIKTHCDIGYNILKNSNSQILKDGSIVALSHHENFDGSGYPAGLKGEKIPMEGRICKVADVFDALVNKRCYKPAFELEKTVGIMKDEMKPGKSFDPDCFDAFLKGLDEIVGIKNELTAKEIR